MSAQTYPATVEGLTAALAALGDTAEAVASRLYSDGYRGWRGDCDSCPAAMYLCEVIPDASTVGVDGDRVTLLRGDQPEVLIKTPGAVSDFVGLFDNGAYEELAVGPEDQDGTS